jgi:hypothetical protein
MSISCDVFLQGSATPQQLTTVGAALWRWCIRAAGDSGVYPYLDNQALADLIAGNFPASTQDQRPSVHFWVRDESNDRRTTVERLRRDMPAKGVEDIQIDGKSWNLVD